MEITRVVSPASNVRRTRKVIIAPVRLHCMPFVKVDSTMLTWMQYARPNPFRVFLRPLLDGAILPPEGGLCGAEPNG